MYALIDCNNFYASCEKVFNPSLEGEPLIILSNNDGCVIARSEEAKAIGIKMAEPAFMISDFLEAKKVKIFSANYALYGDMSTRVIQTLKTFSPDIEVYSIDEVFVLLDNMPQIDFSVFGHEVITRVRRWTGLPVSVGIAPTKTLAKIAGGFAKRTNGLHIIRTPEEISIALEMTAVEDIWGVGEKYAAFLRQHGIGTAAQFADANQSWIRKHMTVMGLRTAMELKGTSCLPLESVIQDKKAIMTARSFGVEITDPAILKEAVSNFTALSAAKLRAQKSCAGQLLVFLNTNRFKPGDPQYNNFELFSLTVPSDSTQELIAYALNGLMKIYRPGYKYKKAGVMLTSLVPSSAIQTSVFDKRDRKGEKAINLTMDVLNSRMGRDKIRIASQGFDRQWKLRQEQLSPAYTTRWEDLPQAKTGNFNQ